MRQKRAKTYKRVMALYTQAFGFRTPYQILVSQDILLSCPSELSIYKALQACVQAECKFMITQCCVEALYKLGPSVQNATNTAKTFERRRCNHREAIDPDECLKDMIGETNKHNYVLASQSGALRQKLQNVPGLPIIHFNPREVLVLSPPSVATTRKKNDLEEKKRLEAERGMEGVVDGDNVLGASGEGGASGRGGLTSVGSTTIRARKVKTKAPNPLSVRKKKVEKRPREEEEAPTAAVQDEEEEADNDNDNDNDTGGKRRKKRKRGKGKGVVAEARAELASMGMGMGMEGAGASDAGSARGSDSE